MTSRTARTGGTPVLRALNTAHVLQTIRAAAPGAVRIADMIDRTGLARPTVTQAVGQLMRADLIVEEAEERESGRMGRPAQVYRLNGLAIPVLGIDIGVHSVAAAISDGTGAVLSIQREPVVRPQMEDLTSTFDRVVDGVLAASGMTSGQIAAVAVATPGIVDVGTGDVELIPAISGWRSFRVRDHLRRIFGCSIVLENDANAALMSVADTSPELVDPLLLVHWGERIGAGLSVSGGLHLGAHHASGEVGLIDAMLTTERGEVGGRLQDLLSTTSIAHLADQAARSEPGGALDRALRSAASTDHAAVLFRVASGGDKTAGAVVDAVLTTFVRALAPVVLALDPSAIVISGGVTRAGRILSERLEQKFAELTVRECPVRLSADSENTVVKGAVQLALRAAWNQLDAANPDMPSSSVDADGCDG